VIQWDQNTQEFIRNALSPAKVGSIVVNNDEKSATVTVTPDQLSLAIGKGGQNVRLAAKLTGFKIDLQEATVSDLDAAMRDAAASGDGVPTSSSAARDRFDALFSATPDGETMDARDSVAQESAPQEASAQDAAPQEAAPQENTAEEQA
jgi:transcription termination/antitermination protein NusA